MFLRRVLELARCETKEITGEGTILTPDLSFEPTGDSRSRPQRSRPQDIVSFGRRSDI